MIIYKITNKINGKIYIGQDSKNNPKYLGSGSIIKKAIEKYGKENFTKEILQECFSIEELNTAEIFWIAKLNSINSKIGYNLTGGGEGVLGIRKYGKENANFGKKWSIDKKENFSKKLKYLEQNKGKNNPNYENGEKIRGDKNPFYNKHHTKKTKDIISIKCKNYWKTNISSLKGKFGISHPSSKYIYFLISPNNIKYENICDLKTFCDTHNLYMKSIMSALRCKRNTYKGWIVWRKNHG